MFEGMSTCGEMHIAVRARCCGASNGGEHSDEPVLLLGWSTGRAGQGPGRFGVDWPKLPNGSLVGSPAGMDMDRDGESL
jgi:hypothetical protein